MSVSKPLEHLIPLLSEMLAIMDQDILNVEQAKELRQKMIDSLDECPIELREQLIIAINSLRELLKSVDSGDGWEEVDTGS